MKLPKLIADELEACPLPHEVRETPEGLVILIEGERIATLNLRACKGRDHTHHDRSIKGRIRRFTRRRAAGAAGH